jgi:hypothetical protein
MKTHIYAGAVALLLSGQSAMASNIYFLEQTGSDLTVAVTQSGTGQNEIHLRQQDGSHNAATIAQSGDGNTNNAWADQVLGGSFNTLTITQNGTGNYNDVPYIRQTGSHNTATITQTGFSNFNVVRAMQITDTNVLTTFQGGEHNFSEAGIVNYDGGANTTTLSQTGIWNTNRFMGQQDGRSTATVNQTGERNTNDLRIIVRGQTAPVTTTVDQDGYDTRNSGYIEQTRGTIAVKQEGWSADNTVNILQKGGVDAKIAQYGLEATNKAELKSTGGGHKATVDQGGVQGTNTARLGAVFPEQHRRRLPERLPVGQYRRDRAEGHRPARHRRSERRQRGEQRQALPGRHRQQGDPRPERLRH